MSSFYNVLGVSATCSSDDVRRAYHQAVRKYHPDKRLYGSDEASAGCCNKQQFLRVQEAYELLRNPELRQQYDAKLQRDNYIQTKMHDTLVIFEEVQLASLQREKLVGEGGETDELLYTRKCRCGGFYEIADEELQDSVDIVSCTGCSLHIRVLYDNI
ncbi:hypothetical protein CCR75_001388 [Bremia lactucae]|uniref:Diphthamide biosynthesis protein 4 n=1 Tax=Bremia lactucae TaxID=4779 RepID=A0A976FMQ1_BRELC|nr:hypothetical protein CCR75_001388 [Bremia lactucae]